MRWKRKGSDYTSEPVQVPYVDHGYHLTLCEFVIMKIRKGKYVLFGRSTCLYRISECSRLKDAKSKAESLT